MNLWSRRLVYTAVAGVTGFSLFASKPHWPVDVSVCKNSVRAWKAPLSLATAETETETGETKTESPIAKPLVVFFGLVCEDRIAKVPTYPKEDAKTRVIEGEFILHRVGGNAANSAKTAAALLVSSGFAVHCLAPLSSLESAAFVVSDLRQAGVGTELCHLQADSDALTTSWVLIAADTGSRTIVNFPASKPLTLAHFKEVIARTAHNARAPVAASVGHFHFEGRWIPQTVQIAEYISTHLPNWPVSIEIEKELPAIDELLPFADILFFSKDWVRNRGFDCDSLPAFVGSIESRARPNAWLIFPWGERGCFGCINDGRYDVQSVASQRLDKAQIQETLGAGDTFNGAFVAAKLKLAQAEAGHLLTATQSMRHCMTFAARVAEFKIQHPGFSNLHEFEFE